MWRRKENNKQGCTTWASVFIGLLGPDMFLYSSCYFYLILCFAYEKFHLNCYIVGSRSLVARYNYIRAPPEQRSNQNTSGKLSVGVQDLFLCVVIYLVYWSSVCVWVALLIIGTEVIKQRRLFKHTAWLLWYSNRDATMCSDHTYCWQVKDHNQHFILRVT